MDARAYLLEVAQHGAKIRAANPSAVGYWSLSCSGLGDTVTAAEIFGTSDDLSAAAADVKITVNKIPTGLSQSDQLMVMVSDLMVWQSKAQVVVVKAEQEAGLEVGASSATERIVAMDRVESTIKSSLSTFFKYSAAVLPESLAPKVSQTDLALSLRRQYNSATAGILAITPVGATSLLQSGTTTVEDIQRDYLHRLMAFQSIVKIGESKTQSATSGLGFLFFPVVGVMVILAAISVVAIIAAAIVATKYITQRNEIWAKVMSDCAKQTTTTEFCKESLTAFKEEPANTIASIFGTNYLLYTVGIFGVLWMLKQGSKK